MRRAVKEVRIPEANVACARCSLLANILQDDLPRDDAKPAIVDWHHRTVPTPVFATAARLHIAGRPPISVRQLQIGIPIEAGQSSAIGDDEILPGERDARLRLLARHRFHAALKALRQGGESFFELTAQYGLDA